MFFFAEMFKVWKIKIVFTGTTRQRKQYDIANI